MQPVEVAYRSVQAIILGDVDLGARGTAFRTRIRDRLRKGVCNLDQVAPREPPLQLGLKAVVVASADGGHLPRVSCPDELFKQLRASRASTDRRPIELCIAELADLAGRDVTSLAHEAPTQPLLQSEIPRLDVSSLQIEWNRLSRDVGRHVDDAVAQAGGCDRWDAVGKASGGRQAVRGRNNQ